MSWPRKGVQWDVFEAYGGTLEIERVDSDDTECEACGTGCPLHGDDAQQLAFEFDDEAAGFVLATAARPPEDCPPEVAEECRAAVREIVASWEVRP